MMVTTERTRVRMLGSVAGLAMPHYGIQGGFAHSEGDTPDLHPELAAAWIRSGQAEPVKVEKEKAAK